MTPIIKSITKPPMNLKELINIYPFYPYNSKNFEDSTLATNND